MSESGSFGGFAPLLSKREKGAFGGPIVYSAKDDNDTKKLDKAIGNLTKLNEIMFEKKISLKKYMISEKN